MKRDRFYQIIIVLLVLTNVGVLFFVLTAGRKEPRGGNRLDKMIIEELRLTENQQVQFSEMKHRHHEQMRELDEVTKNRFEAYFTLLESNAQPSRKDSLEGFITDAYRKKLSITYAHFAELKSILNEAQQQRFSILVPHLLQVMTPRKGGEEGPPPEHFNE